jgi:hypothetical protein
VEFEELRQALSATEPAAVLVPARILRRMVQAEFKVPYLLVQVPHERCYFFDRQVLFSHVEQDELELEPDRMLPPTVILLSRPSTEQLQAQDREATLLRFWRLLFHAQVHLALHQRQQEGKLTPATVRAHIEQIGETEFEEIRTVLQQENSLLPPPDEVNVFVEFAATYLELRYFRTNLRATYFPAIRDFQVIDQILAQHIDADQLFGKSRLKGAPDPVVRTDTSSDESHDYYWKLLRHADRATKDGDIVRAAILRTRAARVAPAALSRSTRASAIKDLETLTLQLQNTIKFSPEEAQEWLQVLPALLDKADQGNWPVEAKLLFDLQTAWNENQRKLFALDVVEWALSAGKRPIKRPLTSLQLVRTAKHLRSAAQRLTMARVSDEERQRLAKLLRSALEKTGDRLRERFRPVLRDAFHDVGLAPANPPEKVALQKIIEEVLDHITDKGFFTFSDLRDTLSRNQLKLPDLADPESFWRGDPLLRLDRRLATLMEGVYRRGEFYLRWLESCSSLFFGTKAGRFVTLNLILPYGGALFVLKYLERLLSPSMTESGALSAFGANTVALGALPPALAPFSVASAVLTGKAEVFGQKHVSSNLQWLGVLLLGTFLLGLLRLPGLRHALLQVGDGIYRGLRGTFYDLPVWLWRLPWLHEVLKSWPFLLVYWYILKPLLVCGVVWLYGALLTYPERFEPWPLLAIVFVATEILLNSRFGFALTETCTEALLLLYSWLRFDVLQGLFRWVLYLFKGITDTLEYVLYTVDEWLRFRSDESRITMVLRAILGVLWFPVGYLIRLYFIMLLEPTLNPIKLPLSSAAFKIMLIMPWYYHLLKPGSDEQTVLIQDYLVPYLGPHLADPVFWAVIIPTLWLLPGVFAFFIWEMQANWRLFRANRAVRLKPVVIGRQGETMLHLLKPGVHSGTIARLFAHLRRAERDAYRTGNWRSARTYRQALREVARSVQVFIERELLKLLQQSPSWREQFVRVEQVVLSCTRIRIELSHAGFPHELAVLAFEERSGWVMGSLPEPGWLRHLTPEQQRVLASALAGLYKLAGVDLVREQLDAVLAPYMAGCDITDHHLVLWTGQRNSRPITYDLWDRKDQLRPQQVNGQEVQGLPVLDGQRLFFSRVPLTWEEWVDYWQQDPEAQGQAPLLSDRVSLLHFGPPARAGSRTL